MEAWMNDAIDTLATLRERERARFVPERTAIFDVTTVVLVR